MTSIANLFSNFTDLVKPKSVTDSASDYTKNNSNPISLSLNQGNKFNNYQKKITNNLAKQANILSGIEGFQPKPGPDDTLTKQTVNLLKKTNVSQNQQQVIQRLKTRYDSIMTEYEQLLATVSGGTSDYINRVSPNNPYLGKNIRFTTGNVCYVTQQGVVKWYPNPDIYNSTAGLNGCPPQGYQQINLPWIPDYNTAGTTIPTNPPLVSGTPMTAGQSCGNEGKNVFVNTMLDNPQSNYVGCYNNLPAPPEVMFVPKMNSSNYVNGYGTFASSVYQNNNGFTGPWNAFDQNINTWWHTYTDSANNLYDGNTGQYTGTTSIPVTNSNGVQTTVKGEWLMIIPPSLIPLTRYEIQGRQGCCGQPNGRDPNTWYIVGLNSTSTAWIQLDYQTNISFNWKMLSFNVSDPTPYSRYLILITVAGDNKAPAGSRSCVQIGQWNLYTTSNYVNNPTPAMTKVGNMNYDQCQSYAVNTGNQYFGLQGVDSNGNGNCMVSNDLAGSQIYGSGVKVKTTALWASKTTGNNPGSTASLTISGTLSVANTSGAAIFSTPNGSTPPSNYIGCYGDKSTRAMSAYNNGSQSYTNTTCQQAAQKIGATYYGLQNSTSGQNAQCFTSSNLGQTQQYGVANNCTKISDGSWSGGGWSNAVYNTTNPSSSFFLILQDDGNLCIYKGASPSDNQGGIWCSMTNGKQQQPNTNFAAANGKFGQNWIATGSTLAANDFVGSTNGSIYLIMQSDGNLVLYTSTSSNKCSTFGNKNTGSQNTNALYQLDEMGVKNSLGQLAYVDQDSELHSYPSTNTQYSNTYTTMTGTDSGGNDISGAAYGGATVDQCQTSCNNNSSCAGFAFSNNVCYPKTSSMYPSGAIQANANVNLYVRNKSPISPPIGVTSTTNNVDTVLYQNYVDGGSIGDSYGLANASSVQKQQLQQLYGRLNFLSNQIINLTNKFETGSQQLEQQAETNVQGITGYVKDIKSTNDKIKHFDTNTDNILNDSDIVVLQKNYDYLFWSIIATTTVIISMNIIKK